MGRMAEIIKRYYFSSKAHKEAFMEMLEDMYLSNKELEAPDKLLKKQLAFIYLIARYQEDYKQYEGDTFYIEYGEELSLGGPTYLLDERYGERKRPYECIVPIAANLLKEIQKDSEIAKIEEIKEKLEGIYDLEKKCIDQVLDILNK